MKIDEQLINKIGIIVFLILISCSKDEVKPNVPNSPSNPPVVEDQSTQQSCLLKTFDSETLSYVILRNDLGLPTKINFIKYRGEDIDYSATFEYDDSHRLIKLENERSFSTYSYDNLGRMVLERLEAYSNPEIYAERSFIYNEDGYLDSAYHSPDDYERFVYDDHGNVTKRFVKNRGQAEFLVQEYLEFDD